MIVAAGKVALKIIHEELLMMVFSKMMKKYFFFSKKPYSMYQNG